MYLVMNNTEIVSQILGNTNIARPDFPRVKWTSVDGNAFSIIGTASKAWRSKDREVANRIGSVLMSNADSYDTLLGVCLEICPMDSKADEDEEDEFSDWGDDEDESEDEGW
jgi:hypothetical protein